MSNPWFNRTVIGAGITSFLADAGYEMATAILPAFLLTLGLPPDAAARAVGAIEGTGYSFSSTAGLRWSAAARSLFQTGW